MAHPQKNYCHLPPKDAQVLVIIVAIEKLNSSIKEDHQSTMEINQAKSIKLSLEVQKARLHPGTPKTPQHMVSTEYIHMPECSQ
eukprot:4933100-Ditylum_brightwellii.AAC.1